MRNWRSIAMLLLVCSFPATVGHGAAIPGYAFWSFNDGTGGALGANGTYPNPHAFTPAHEEDLPGAPEFRITGTDVRASSASTPGSFTTASGLIVGGNRVLQWERGPSGEGTTDNSFTFSFDSIGYEDFQVRFQYRLTNGMNSYTFSDIQYSLDNGSQYQTAVAVMPTLTANQTWVTYTLDLSSLDAIEDQSSVLLRFRLPNMPNANNSFRLDNVELTSSVIVPEPFSIIYTIVGSLGVILHCRRRA